MPILLFQRTIVRMSLDPDRPVAQQAPKVIRHLLDPHDSTRALCGYQLDPGDIVDGSTGLGYYADATSGIHDVCEKLSEEQAEDQ
jgi:hypothetical protein